MLENSSSSTVRHLTDFSPGVLGVVLFFLVSGYVMPLSARRGFVPTDFALRRIARIYPALLTAFALWAISGLFVPSVAIHVQAATAWDWIANVLLIQEFVKVPAFVGVTWTLILEFAWYGLFGLAMYVAPRRAPAILARGAHLSVLGATLLSLAIDHRIPLGRIGMIYAAVIGMQAYRYSAGDLSRRAFLTDASAFIILMALANTVAFGVFHHPKITWGQSFWPWLVAPALFFCTLIPSVRHSAFFRSRTLAWFGAISLSLYLLHPIAMGVLGPTPYSAATMLGIVVLTIVASIVVYYGVERPGIELRRRISKRLVPRITAEAV